MADLAIRVETLGKKYLLDHRADRPMTLRETLGNSLQFWRRKHRSRKSPSTQGSTREEFWALKDLSFEIRQGDRVGVIGRNGAGKSTLLKILSRITEPTRGRVAIRGRVASLLEVGTGFHPELTGRENIYLNGAILGMSRLEIQRKFDEIVAFAEVERFLDTPVKRYSSGMYVRLAFAVAAHLEPEILVVDEVLAVGDTQFQQKCLGKMEDVGREGRTVLFVSHNMSVIQQLCTRAIYLKQGMVEYDGLVLEGIEHYLASAKLVSKLGPLALRSDRQGSGKAIITNFYILDDLRREQAALQSGKNYILVMEYRKDATTRTLDNVVGSVALRDNRNEIIFLVRSSFTNQNFTLEDEVGTIECHIEDLNLTVGTYSVVLFLSLGETEVLDCIDFASEVLVEGGDFFQTGSIGLPSHCKVLTRANWRVK